MKPKSPPATPPGDTPRKWYAVADPLFGKTTTYSTLQAACKAFDALLMKPEPPAEWSVHTR